MKHLPLITILLVCIFAFNAFAKTGSSPFPKNYSEINPTYDCYLQVFAEDYFEKSFRASGSGNHGGEETTFNFGLNEVTLLADHQWLAVHWMINGELVGQTTTVVGNNGSDERVVMIYNPKNTDHYTSVSCSRIRGGEL